MTAGIEQRAPARGLLLTRRRRRFIAGGMQMLLLVFVGLVVFGPLLVLAIFSFNDSTILAFPLKGFTAQWYSEAFGNASLREALGNSLKIAVVVTPLCLLLGLLSAVGLTRFVFKGRAVVSGLVMIPLVLPWLVIGISGLLFYDWVGRKVFPLELSLLTAGAMHLVIAFPLVTALISAQLLRIDRHLEEAALDLGATPRESYRYVIFPLLIPTLAASAIFVFSWSFNDFIVAFFTLGFENTFPVWVFSSLRRARNLPVVNAISTLVSFVQIVVVWAAWRVLRRQSEKQGQNFTDVIASGA